MQFIMFYACSLDPDDCGVKFADILTDVFVDKCEDPTSRYAKAHLLLCNLSRLVRFMMYFFLLFLFSYLALRKECFSDVIWD